MLVVVEAPAVCEEHVTFLGTSAVGQQTNETCRTSKARANSKAL